MSIINELINTVAYRPMMGDYIEKAILDAKQIAKENSERFGKHYKCIFVFNGVVISVSEFSDVKERMDYFSTELKRMSEESSQSESSKKYKEEAFVRTAMQQSKMNELMSHERISKWSSSTHYDYVELCKWLLEFTSAADHIDVTYNKKYLLQLFASLGFENKACMGMVQAAYKDPKILLRYIIGQVIDMIQTVGCPHPVFVEKFCTQYLKLVEAI